jgi:hypothetical protein
MLLYFLSIDGFAMKEDFAKSKSINKSYQVGKNHELDIENKFGEVKITTWDKNEIVVNIIISIESNSEKETLKRLDNIDVRINEDSDKTSFETYFKNEKHKNNNGKSEMSIDYEVKMPKSNKLTLDNSFGAFIINDLDGQADITVKFGSARMGKLNNDENELLVEFSDPVEVDHFEKGKITVKYSKLKLNSSTQLNLDSEFSNSEIEGVGNLDLDIKFGSFKVDQIIDADVNSNMSSIQINTLVESGDFEAKYGSLTIDLVKKGMRNLKVDGEFSPIKITIEEGASFNAEIYGSMANINVPSEGWSEKVKEINSKSFKGSFGQASENRVHIRSSFGNVKLDF